MKLKLLSLLVFLFSCCVILANDNEELMRLEADMLKYFSTNDIDTFFGTTNRLKTVSKKAGNERLFYRAWGNQAIFEATHQDYKRALEIVEEMMADAKEENSIYGEYAAMHARATVLLQKQSYNEAESAYLAAVDFWHKNFPGESAGEDLQELMKIANHRKDGKAGVAYARQILGEPNVAPIHKGRALYRLSQMAFNKNDVEEFNRIYKQMMELKKTDGIGTLKPIVEVNYNIMNGNFEEALQLSDDLDSDIAAERKALIYHRMGDNDNAYKYMQLYKRISDSITLVSHGNVVASCYVQMNNERLQLEQHLLERQNNRLRNRFYATFGISVILLLLFVIYKRQRIIKLLKNDNLQLNYAKKDAERALDELTELSFYESKKEIPLDAVVKVDDMCNKLTRNIQKQRSRRGVSVLFMTDLPSEFTIKTNADALEKLVYHLLEYSARYTHKGTIKLTCSDADENILFSVADTSAGLSGQGKNNIIGMFAGHGNKVRYVGMNFNICQSITRLLHGRIWLDTEYTNGTRFCFEIPKVP